MNRIITASDPVKSAAEPENPLKLHMDQAATEGDDGAAARLAAAIEETATDAAPAPAAAGKRKRATKLELAQRALANNETSILEKEGKVQVLQSQGVLNAKQRNQVQKLQSQLADLNQATPGLKEDLRKLTEGGRGGAFHHKLR